MMKNSNVINVLGQIVRLIEPISDDANSNTNEGPSTSTPSTSSTTVTTPATNRQQNSRTQVSGQEIQVLSKNAHC